MAFDKELIAKVNNYFDIVDVISSYVKLKKSSNNFLGLCPFHSEKTPSFTVSRSKQFYHCFGCGAHGNVINFLMSVKNASFIDVFKDLAAQASIEIPSYSKGYVDRFKLHKEVLNYAKDFYIKQLNSNEPALNYLKSRSLNQSLIEKFNLGYAPLQRNLLHDYLIKKGFKANILLELGLAKENENKNMYDFFADRIIFPISDSSNQVIAFGGRSISDKMPKYLNSPDSDVYHKSKNLYAIEIASKAWAYKSRAIVVEGYMDCLTLHQHNFNEAVASCGTAVTSDQLALIAKKKVEKVYLMLDSDSAGLKATLNTIPLLLQENIPYYIVDLKGYKDPDDYLNNNNAEKLENLIQHSALAEDFIIDYRFKEAKDQTIQVKSSIINELSELADNDPVKQQLFQQKIAAKFNIDPASLKITSTKKIDSPKININVKNQKLSNQLSLAELKILEKNDRLAFIILSILIKYPEHFETIKSNISLDSFSNSEINAFYASFTEIDLNDRLQLTSDTDIINQFKEFSSICGFLSLEVKLPLENLTKIQVECYIYDFLKEHYNKIMLLKMKASPDSQMHKIILAEYKENLLKIADLNHYSSYKN